MLNDQNIRNAEYYNMTEIFDTLYAQSKNGKKFTKLCDIICSENNVNLAYRNIKDNKGSRTPGIDNKTISDYSDLTANQLRKIVVAKVNNYNPKPVKRIEIPKSDGKTRPLGIPCMEDRLFQQCIKQVLEPICEAKFYNYSFGFRPNRSVSQAIARAYFLMQKNKLTYCVNVDIKGFFDNINHEILIKQMWNMGICDKKLLSIVKAMLKAPIQYPNKVREIPTKGSPQGGILSPLLANIVLNDLDWWIASQWADFETVKDYTRIRTDKGKAYVDKSNKYTELRKKSNLKEMFIVRYADDFKIFCRNYSDAIKIYEAVKQWLKIRLQLEISEEKSGITNLKQKYMTFLGFDIKLKEKGGKWVVQSHMSDKSIERIKLELSTIIKDIQKANSNKTFYELLNQYNATVLGIHNFYNVATDISIDLQKVGLDMERLVYNRLSSSYKITKQGDFATNSALMKNYGKSKQMRFINNRPLIPIAYIRTKPPSSKVQEETPYSVSGRALMRQGREKGVDLMVLKELMSEKLYDDRIEYHDNRISKYCSQSGKCAITKDILRKDNIHCHHKIPISMGGSDKFDNLVIVKKEIHILIHATQIDTINQYKDNIENKEQLNKLNKLRRVCGLNDIEITFE